MPGHHPPRSKLVDSALTALHQGLNPLDAALFAINHHFGFGMRTSQHMPTGAAPLVHGTQALEGKAAQAGSGPPPAPPAPAPKPCTRPPAGVSCPRGWYWDTRLCGCEPIPVNRAQ